jgi:imidazolonepropionase-like amidohydrolase
MRHGRWISLAVVMASLALLAAPPAPRAQTPTVTIFEGARLLTGDGVVIENSAFIVANDRFVGVGRRGQLMPPPGASRVDLSGKTVMPALVDDHVHMGYRTGTSFSADNYTRENLIDMLDRYAFYGVAAILETGTGRGDLPYRVRAEARSGARYLTAGSGFGMPNAGPGGAMRDSAYGVTTEEEARKDVRELAAHKPDMVKIWVDDRNGTVEKLKPNLYRAIIDEAHKNNLRVMAHVFALDDVKDLVRSGIDGFAHMVRDKDVDDELIALLKARPNVFFVETLWGERRALYTAKPAWVDDPALRQAFSAEDIAQLAVQLTPDPKADSKAVERARALGATNLRNTAKLYAAGVRLGLGTDTGGVTGGQFFGLGSHVELELLVTKAGLTPMQAVTLGTHTAAEILGLDELGMVGPGKSADFIVLDANPLDDIANTRRIDKVYLRGQEVPRAALAARWQSQFRQSASTR